MKLELVYFLREKITLIHYVIVIRITLVSETVGFLRRD